MNNSVNSGIMNYDINVEKNNKDKMTFVKYKLPNLLKVKHLKKNSTFSNFNSENVEEQNKNKLINSTKGFNFVNSGLNQNNKGRILNKIKNEDSEKDEIIIFPSSGDTKNIQEEEQNGPKILKVIKKK